MITTIEGIELGEQIEILCRERCMQIRGYLFSQSKPARKIPMMVRSPVAGARRLMANCVRNRAGPQTQAASSR
jgi:hypothetical protein